MSQHPAGFMSYARNDDDHEDGRISELRNRLVKEVRLQSGDNNFDIFQDRNDIAWGEQWEKRIEESLDAGTFLFPIITPGFFKSKGCRKELERFLKRETQLGRDDLILPIYYVDTQLINKPTKTQKDELAAVIAQRQYADWRNLRFDSIESSEIRRKLAELATQVVRALERSTVDTAPQAPIPLTGVEAKTAKRHPDPRLNEIIEFGTTLEEIATNFKLRMDQFNSIDGAVGEKFLDFGAHVYSCCARSLDLFVAKNDPAQEHGTFVQDVSLRLKRLAGHSPDYSKTDFLQYWADGTEIADQLLAHARHAERFG